MTSILTNTGAMNALQNLQLVNRNLETIQTQISSGRTVNTAADNAAIWSITRVMESDVNGFNAISESLNLGQSTVVVARDAAESITDLLNEAKTRIISAQEENVDRKKIQADIDQLVTQIGTIADAAQFNGLNLLKEGGDVYVLSSLNREASGVVSSSKITVERQNLETTEQVVGTGAVLTSGTIAAVSGGDAVWANGEVATLDFTGAISAGDSFTLELGSITGDPSHDISYVARNNDTINNVVRELARRIEALNLPEFAVATSEAGDPLTGTASLAITNLHATGTIDTATATNLLVQQDGGTPGGGLDGLRSLSVLTDVGAEQALADIETYMQYAIQASSSLGSVQKRLDIQSEFVSQLTDSMRSGIGALVDTDMEAASARLQALQVQQQLGVQALSIANRAPQNILALFQG